MAWLQGREVFELLERLSPAPAPKSAVIGARDGTSHTLTTGVVRVIRPMLLARGLKLGALTELNHSARGEDADSADSEILAIAARDQLPVITNAGYTARGVSDLKSDGSRSLRGRCRDQGVPVFTPGEYLATLGVNVEAEAHEFIAACSRAVLDAYVDAGGASYVRTCDRDLGRDLDNDGWLAMLEDLIPLYRMILFDEVADELQHITPAPVPSRRSAR